MNTKFINKYNSSDEDEKISILINIIEQIDDDIYQFLLDELIYEDDEFVLIEIIKVLSLYSPVKYNDELVRKFFEIIECNDDDLIQTYAMQSLGHLKLLDLDYKKIKDIIEKKDNEDLVASGRMVLHRNNIIP